jgi:hypothetical protein
MKLTITALKAPWPAGAGIGDVVEIEGDAIPGAFVGKCEKAEAKAKATHTWPEAPVVDPMDDLRAKLKAAEAALASMEDAALKAADEHAAALAAMTQRAEAAEAALAKIPKK